MRGAVARNAYKRTAKEYTAVGAETRVRAGHPPKCGSIPANRKTYISEGPGAHLPSYSMDPGKFFPATKQPK
jgi:hypothetical protein